MKYTVVTAFGAENLIKDVNKLIGEGWQPIGGVSTARINETVGTVTTSGYAFAQAMIKP